MTRQKDLKRLGRAPEARGSATPKDYAKLAGKSDAVMKERTGCAWDKWVKSLDYHGAATMTHREIAELVQKKYKVGGWWAQTVAVGYERIKGLRAIGQRGDGSYEASKSRTFDVPVEVLFDAWSDAAARKLWIGDATVRVRTANRPKTMRIDWNGNSIVAVGFTPKGESKSAVAVQHPKLESREKANELKKYWAERLDALSAVLKKDQQSARSTL